MLGHPYSPRVFATKSMTSPIEFVPWPLHHYSYPAISTLFHPLIADNHIYIYTDSRVNREMDLIFFLSRVSSIRSILTFFLIHAFENLVLVLPLLFGEWWNEREKKEWEREDFQVMSRIIDPSPQPRINIFFSPSFPSLPFFFLLFLNRHSRATEQYRDRSLTITNNISSLFRKPTVMLSNCQYSSITLSPSLDNVATRSNLSYELISRNDNNT